MRRSLLFLLMLGCAIRAQGAELIFGSGLEHPCAEDVDRDRLADCVETGTGTFVSAANAGTSALDGDTDGDGVSDGDEVLGTAAGLDLSAMGASPVRKNLFLEYDWMVDGYTDGCAAGSHRPTQSALALVDEIFGASTLANPDGTTGITVIHDYGQGGAFTGGNLVEDDDGVIEGKIEENAYQQIVSSNFAEERRGIFRYVLMAHRFVVDGSNTATGQGLIGGDQVLVALHCSATDYNRASAISHEVGHTLGLRHGGGDDCGFKPNYDSVMNYRFHFFGADGNCDGIKPPIATGPIRFSDVEQAPLNENALIDALGVCGAPGIDWNNNGVFDVSARDVNSSELKQPDRCGGFYTTLYGYDDWDHVTLKPAGTDFSPPVGTGESVVCTANPEEGGSP